VTEIIDTLDQLLDAANDQSEAGVPAAFQTVTPPPKHKPQTKPKSSAMSLVPSVASASSISSNNDVVADAFIKVIAQSVSVQSIFVTKRYPKTTTTYGIREVHYYYY
jgi:hypothetical protein